MIGSPQDLKQPMSVHIMDYLMNPQHTPGHPMTALPCPLPHHGTLRASKDPQMDPTWIPNGPNSLTPSLDPWTKVASEILQ